MSMPLSPPAAVLRKNDLLSKLYERNQETGNYVIEVALDRYSDVFNDWDHAAFRKRDMNPELAYFLEDCSREIPLRHDVDVFFYLPKEVQNPEREKIISEVLHNYYNFYASFEKRQLQKAYQKLFTYVAAAFLLITLNILMGHQANVLFSTFAQGLLVGGWVFLWEAISFLFMKRSDNQHLIRTYTRLGSANVYFRYEAKQGLR
jgi:hypothetical protein